MAVGVSIISSFDAKGINKAMRDFKKLDNATDKTAFGLKNLDASVSKFGKSMGKFALVGGAVAGVIGKTLVDAALESQKVMKQTEAIIKASGGAANITAEQVQKLSDKLSLQTGIDDELIQSSANLLLVFQKVRNETGKGNQIFDRATQAALDLGNVFGSSDAAAKALGRALTDPVKGLTALRRAGVMFDDSQKKQIKTMVHQNEVRAAEEVGLNALDSINNLWVQLCNSW